MMGCAMDVADPVDWLSRFHHRAAANRIPVTAHLALTHRCNLRCRHCYLGNRTEQHKLRALEQDTAAVKASLDEWAAAGCFHLVLTGGDPMMRNDFADIYRHAAEQGIFVTVFCDGMLVTDRIVGLFKEWPPRSVEISIYGATAETYERVTRVPGSHARAWKGIHRLLAIGVRVMLKTVVLTLNQHELQAMAAQAEDLGCDFRFDSAVFPCLPDNGREPLDVRVSPEVAVACDLAFAGRREVWAESIRKHQQRRQEDALYPCGAGVTAFYADPYGNLSPCLMTTQYRYSGKGRAFRDLWQDELNEIRLKKRTREGGCLYGHLRGACTHCPAFNYLETGDEEVDSPHMKRTAELRYDAVMNKGGGTPQTRGAPLSRIRIGKP